MDLEIPLATAVKGLAVLTAIPVVLLALWAQYFEQYLREVAERKVELDRRAEVFRVRAAGLFAMVSQLILFLGSSEVRSAYPLLANALFFSAIVLQALIQAKSEKKLRGTEDRPADHLALALRSFAGCVFGAGIYFGSLLVLLKSSFIIAMLLPFGDAAKSVIIVLGAVLGNFAGLALNFALGPTLVRIMMPTSEPGDASLGKEVERLFREAGLSAPRLWLLETARFRSATAMMAGFRSGRGFFRPALFVSRTLLTELAPAELCAVVRHEVSHICLRHLKKRLVLSLTLVVGTAFAAAVAIVVTHFVLPSAGLRSFLVPAAAIGAFMLTFQRLGRQNAYHEVEADVYAVEVLGSRLEDLASALRKLDRLNDKLADARDPMAFASGMGHPPTERRIRILTEYFAHKAELEATRKAA